MVLFVVCVCKKKGSYKQLLVYVCPVNFNTKKNYKTLTSIRQKCCRKTMNERKEEKKVTQLFMANTYDSFSIKLCNFILLISREKQKCHLFIFYEILDLVLSLSRCLDNVFGAALWGKIRMCDYFALSFVIFTWSHSWSISNLKKVCLSKMVWKTYISLKAIRWCINRQYRDHWKSFRSSR